MVSCVENRVENADAPKVSLRTLLNIAAALDLEVGLVPALAEKRSLGCAPGGQVKLVFLEGQAVAFNDNKTRGVWRHWRGGQCQKRSSDLGERARTTDLRLAKPALSQAELRPHSQRTFIQNVLPRQGI